MRGTSPFYEVKCVLGLLGSMLALLAAAPAAAQTADALVEEGLSLREQGRDEEALSRFEAAYRQDASPRTLAQIALAEMALARWIQAEQHLVQAMGTQHEWIQSNQVALNGALAGIRDNIGRLQVESDQPGAELWVDGQRAGTLPLAAPITRMPGQVTFEVRADGFQTESRTVELSGGQVTREVVRMTPSTSDAGPGAGAFSNRSGGTEASGGGVSIPGVILLAAGGAALVAGGVLLGVALADKDALENPEGMPEWTPETQAAADLVPVLATTGEVLLGVGVAALAVGVVLMVVDGGGDDSQARVRDGRLEVRF